MRFPPFKHAVLITVRSAHEVRANFSAETLARRLTEALPAEFILSSPTPAPLEKLQGQFRLHILIHGTGIMPLSRLIREALDKFPFPEDVTVAVDVDPYRLLYPPQMPAARFHPSSTQRSTVWPLLAFLISFAVPAARAGFVETFENGSDDGNWHLTSDPSRLLVIEPTGGNPGAYLHGQVDAAVPTWYVPLGTTPTHFLGDYAARGVGVMSFDVNIFSGLQVPGRAVTLDLETTFGTGDFTKGVDAYYIGTDISKLPVGWHTYVYPLDATSPTIPPGWVVTRGNGKKGTDADWQALMQDVETIGLELGKPGYAYPFSFWDLGLDNVRIAK
jgi:hypothetical protein